MRPRSQDPVAVIGAGSFGTALAQLLAERHLPVRLWARRESQAAALRQHRENREYLPGLPLHVGIMVTASLQEALTQAAWVVVATPAQRLRAILGHMRPFLAEQPLVLGAKGLELDSLMTMDEVAMDVLGEQARSRILVLSGPSFAREIMEHHPTAVTLAGYDEGLARSLGERMFCDSFRVYPSHDVVGVGMGGALKNVLAIAAGGLVGMGIGANTHAALVTRGLTEITRLAVTKGAHPMTLAGLSGLGDLVLTCGSPKSRNRTLGEALGRGASLAEALAAVHQVAEGVETARSAYRLAQRLQVDAPITHAVYRVLHEGVPAQQALLDVVRRPPKLEY